MPTLHFLYHEIRPETSVYTYATGLRQFEAQADFLAASLRNAVDRGKAGAELVRPAITFDDGHLSDYEYALPVLERLGLSACFFITAGWTGERAGYMGWRELRALQSTGHTVGAHGFSHKLLTHCSPEELKRELGDSRSKLEDGLGVSVTTMSLPGGRYNARVLAACQEAQYERVFTSVPQVESAPSVDELVGRVNLLVSSDVALLRDLLSPNSRKLAALRRSYEMKRGLNRLLGDSLYARVWALVNRQQDADENAGADA